jgi:hypothetical protein
MKKDHRRDITLSIFGLLDIVAAGGAILVLVGAWALAVARWLIGV